MLERKFQIEYAQRVLFTRQVFDVANTSLRDLIASARNSDRASKVFAFIDSHVAEANPHLKLALEDYVAAHSDVMKLAGAPVIVMGGESCKNDFTLVEQCWKVINDASVDRHSYVFVIGGGAILDLVCFAASTAHRGVRQVRFPTTTLSQGDGGVGVKNGVNYFGKKNWVGSFSVPFAIVNDSAFLDTLPVREKRCGLIEAIKVALIRDATFYYWLEDHLEDLAQLKPEVVEYAVRRSAEIHVEHIATSGDPFENGSARPLDFGHWIAHKLEQVSHFQIEHGEAVAIGMAVDLLYSVRAGLLDEVTAMRIIHLIQSIGFAIHAPELEMLNPKGELIILAGLDEFREHLGGDLSVTLIPEIGRNFEVHEMEKRLIAAALDDVKRLSVPV
ncbi:3-dehydroquinate synthase [soil metagenome]